MVPVLTESTITRAHVRPGLLAGIVTQVRLLSYDYIIKQRVLQNGLEQ